MSDALELLWGQLPSSLPSHPPEGAQWERLERVPTMGENYRAILSRRKPRIERGDALPALGVEASLKIDPDWLRRYYEVCGFTTRRDESQAEAPLTVPLTIPQVIAAPLQTHILASRALPVKVLGVVHAANEIIADEPIEAGVELRVAVWVGETRWRARGFEFDLHTVVYDDARDAPLWRARTVIFRSVSAAQQIKPQGESTRSSRPADLIIEGAREALELPADLGRRYAPIAADYNPIHLYPITARLFGFKRPIIHGMWTLAHLLRVAQDQGVISALDRGALTVRFRKPLSLPQSGASILARYDEGEGEGEGLCAQALDERDRVAVEVTFRAHL